MRDTVINFSSIHIRRCNGGNGGNADLIVPRIASVVLHPGAMQRRCNGCMCALFNGAPAAAVGRQGGGMNPLTKDGVSPSLPYP